MSINEQVNMDKETRYVLQGAVKIHTLPNSPFGISADWRDLKTLEEPVLNGDNMKEFKDGKINF
jgi:hypothetical protein